MNTSATNLLNRMNLNDIKGTSTINELISRIHNGGSRRRVRHKKTRIKNQSRKNRVNKKYTWPFW